MLSIFFERIIENWDSLKTSFRPYFERFLDVIQIKIDFMSFSTLVYQTLYNIRRALEILMDYKGSRKKLNLEDHLTDHLFQHYIQEIQTKATRNGAYSVRDPETDQRVILSEFMATFK